MEGNEEHLTRTSSVLQKVHLFETSSDKMQLSYSTKTASTESSETMLHTSTSNDPSPETSCNHENVKLKCKQPLDSAESSTTQEKHVLESSHLLRPAPSQNESYTSRQNDTSLQPPKPAPRPSPRPKHSSRSPSDNSHEVQYRAPKCPIPLPRFKVLSPQFAECPTDEGPDSSGYLMGSPLTSTPTISGNMEPHTLHTMPKSKSDFNIAYTPEQVSRRLQPPTPSPRPSSRVRHSSETLPSYPHEFKQLDQCREVQNKATKCPTPLPRFKISSPKCAECSIDEGPDSSGDQTDYNLIPRPPRTGNTEPIAGGCVLSIPTDPSTPQATDSVRHSSSTMSRSQSNVDVNYKLNIPRQVAHHPILKSGAPIPSPRVRRAHATPSHCRDIKESQKDIPPDCQMSIEIECPTNKSLTDHDLGPLVPLCNQSGQTPTPLSDDKEPTPIASSGFNPKQHNIILMEDSEITPKPQNEPVPTESSTHQVYPSLQTESSTGASDTCQVGKLETSPPVIPPKPPSMVCRKPVPVSPLQSEGKLASETGATSGSAVEFSAALQTINPEAQLLTATKSETRAKKNKPPISAKPNKQALHAKKFISSNVVKPGLKFAKRVQKKFERVKFHREKSENQLQELSADEDFDELPEGMKSDFCEEFLLSAEMALSRLLGLDEFSSASDQTAMKQIQKQIYLKEIPISVFGIHNAGKSTLLNVLLGARCLPVANTNETSVRVTIEHDKNVHEGFCPQGKECKVCPWISADSEVRASGIKNIYEFLININHRVRRCRQEAKEYTIHAHVPLIATTNELKLCFEDTPGFGEADHDNIIKQAETALSGSSAYLYIMPYDQIDDGRNIKAFESIHGRDEGAFMDGRVLIVITHFDKHYDMKTDDDYDDDDDDEYANEGDNESMVSTPKSIVSAVHEGVHKATGMNISERNVVLVSGLWALHSLMLRNNTKEEKDIKPFTLWKLKKYADDNNIDECQWKTEKNLEARLWEASGFTAVVERINNLVKCCFELWIRGLHGKCEKFLQFAEETVQGNVENFIERDLKDMETEYATLKKEFKSCEQHEDEMQCLLTKERSPAYQDLQKCCSEDVKEPHKCAWDVVERHFEDFSSKCKLKYKQKHTQDDFESDITSFLTEKASPTFLEEFRRHYDPSRAFQIKSTHSEELVIISENLIRATCNFVGKSHDQGVPLDNEQELPQKGPRAQEVITRQELDLEEFKDKLPAPTFKRDVIQYILHMMTLGITGDDGRRVDVEGPLKKLHEQLSEGCMQYRSSITQTLVEHVFNVFQEAGKKKLQLYHQKYDEDVAAARARLHKQKEDVEEARNKVQNMYQLVFYCSRMRTHLSRMKRDLLQASLAELDESDTSAEDDKSNLQTALTGEVCTEIQHEFDKSDTPVEEFDKKNLKTALTGEVCTNELDKSDTPAEEFDKLVGDKIPENQHENEFIMDSLEEHVLGQVTVYYPEGSVREVNIQSGTTLRALLLSSAAESEDLLSEYEPYIDHLKIDWESDCTSLSGKKIVLVQKTVQKATEAEANTSDSIFLAECPTPVDETVPRRRTQAMTKRTFFFRSSKRRIRLQGGIAAIKLIDNQRPVNTKTKPPEKRDEVMNTFEEDFKNPDLLSTCKAIKHRLKELQQEYMVLNLVSSELLSLWEETDEKRICIAVFGYHKTGKSSFINALAGMGLLPVSRRKETERKVNLQHNSDIHSGPCKKSCQNCQVLLFKDRTTCSEVARGRRIASTLHDIHKKIQDRVAQEQGDYIIQANIPCISAVTPPWQVYLQDNPSFSVVTDKTAIRNLRDDVMTLSLYVYLVRYDQLDDSVNAGAFRIIAEQDLAKAAGLEQRLLIVVTHFEAYYDDEDFLDEKSLKAKVCKLIKDAISREFPPDNVIPVCTLWACKGQQLSHQLENEDLKLDALLSLESCYAKFPKGSVTANPKDMSSSELAESLIAVSGIREVETKVSQMACSFMLTSVLTIYDGFSHYLGAAAQKVEDLKTKLSEDLSRKELKRRTMEIRNRLDNFKHGPKSAVYTDLLLQCQEQTTTLSVKLIQRSKGLLRSLHEECLQSIEKRDEAFTREKLLSEFTELATKLENMQEKNLHESLPFIQVTKCFEDCIDAVDTNYSEVCQYVNASQHMQPQALPAVKLEPGEVLTIIAESMRPLQIKHEEIATDVDLPQPKRSIAEMLRKRPKWYTSGDQIERSFSTFETLIRGKISTYTDTMEQTITQAVFRKFCKYADTRLKEFDKNFAELLKDDEEEMKRLTAWNEHLRKLQQHLKLKYEESLVVN